VRLARLSCRKKGKAILVVFSNGVLWIGSRYPSATYSIDELMSSRELLVANLFLDGWRGSWCSSNALRSRRLGLLRVPCTLGYNLDTGPENVDSQTMVPNVFFWSHSLGNIFPIENLTSLSGQ
jgi:hypothetical protein